MVAVSTIAGSRIVIPKQVVAEILDGEAVVLNVESGQYFALNRTATRFWELIRELGDGEQVCARVAIEFGIAPERARADFMELLEALCQRGLVATG